MTIEVDQQLYQDAAAVAAQNHITVDEQIDMWARVGRTALDNPDMPVAAIQDLIVASKQQSEPLYQATDKNRFKSPRARSWAYFIKQPLYNT